MDVPKDVYPPSEDTYFLADTLLSILPRHPICLLEIGTGSAFIPSVLRAEHGCHASSYIVATDINPSAMRCLRQSLFDMDALMMDLATAIRSPLFDVIVFNPPYVPTPRQELNLAQRRRDVSASWAGGEDGRELTIRAIQEIGVWHCRVLFSRYIYFRALVDKIVALTRMYVFLAWSLITTGSFTHRWIYPDGCTRAEQTERASCDR